MTEKLDADARRDAWHRAASYAVLGLLAGAALPLTLVWHWEATAPQAQPSPSANPCPAGTMPDGACI